MAFTNRNVCKSFSVASASMSQAPTGKVRLADQECSEVIVLSHATQGSIIYDDNNPTVGFWCPLHEEMVFRGLTNSNQLSVCRVNSVADGDLNYRTQFFSNFPEPR